MVVHEPQQTVLPTCQPGDNEQETQSECAKTIPESWKLTQQQQAFIDLFSEDDQPKQ